MAVNDVLETRVICKLDDQISINVLHWKVTALTLAGATMQEIATAFDNLFQSVYTDLMSSTASYRGCYAQKVFPLPKGAAFESSTPLAGTRSTEPLPPQSCGLIATRGDLAGRHNRGRIYLPFPAENDNGTTHIPSTTYVTNATTWMTTILINQTVVGAGGTVTMKPVILNRLTGATVDVTGGRVRPGWATQRRRSAFGQKNVSPF